MGIRKKSRISVRASSFRGLWTTDAGMVAATVKGDLNRSQT